MRDEIKSKWKKMTKGNEKGSSVCLHVETYQYSSSFLLVKVALVIPFVTFFPAYFDKFL